MFKKLRKSKGFTQKNLAEALEMKQCSISNWENGISKPDIPTAAKIAKLFNCEVLEVVACFVEEDK